MENVFTRRTLPIDDIMHWAWQLLVYFFVKTQERKTVHIFFFLEDTKDRL